MSGQRAPTITGHTTADVSRLQRLLKRSSASRHQAERSATVAARIGLGLYFALVVLAGVVAAEGTLGIGSGEGDVGLGKPTSSPSASGTSSSLASSATHGTTPSALGSEDRGVMIIFAGLFGVGLVSTLMVLLVIFIRRIIHTRTVLAPLRAQNPSLYWRILLSNDAPSIAELGRRPPVGETLNLEALQKLDTERPEQRRHTSLSADARLVDARHTECPVCLDPLFAPNKVIRRLPCGHRFHTTCVDAWLVQRRGVCPVCRRDLTVVEGIEGAGERGSSREVEMERSADNDVRVQFWDYNSDWLRRRARRRGVTLRWAAACAGYSEGTSFRIRE
ncbi:hypothetical protein M427DRAFT_70453 [Gonapodya prolifera JEL478]|uniref:RING-type domain-containing protein n=1 Tax=Gonapodya prolifera (strain JEL478) TaxID=1344416 RepID=A0A139AD25_GONPJ|nr:hypothetical protein M427DRAFT_70453 [Gonapodya prolifera JEL478]|eukprot:KXS14670.1 hypothetical protein M427DRAFT_70453 [Gonapodya prolifera JEL478]